MAHPVGVRIKRVSLYMYARFRGRFLVKFRGRVFVGGSVAYWLESWTPKLKSHPDCYLILFTAVLSCTL